MSTRMKWGDLSRPRPSTEVYRKGMDKIFGKDADKERSDKQNRLFEEAQEEKARLKILLAS